MMRYDREKLIIDTGYWIALVSKTDAHHKAAIQLRPQIENRRWITTWPVITEASYILANRAENHALYLFFKLFESETVEIFDLRSHQISRIGELIKKYANLPMDLADASLVILAEEQGNGDIVATDERDFNTYRWKNHKPFNNIFSQAARAASYKV